MTETAAPGRRERLWGFWPRLFGLRERPVRRAHGWVVNASVVLFALSIAVSVHDMHHGCSADLRSRIVQARAMKAGLDPYFYVWTPALSERLADCYVLPLKMVRSTAPPSMAWCYSLISGLPWTVIRWLFFWLDEAALLALALLLARLRVHKTDRDRTTVVFLVLVAVACSPIWRVHVERGQYYIYPVLLIGLAFFCLDRLKPAWAGVALAAATFLRPSLAPLALPFLATRKWPVVLGGAAGLAVLMAVSWPGTGTQVYRSSKLAMADWDMQLGQQYRDADPNSYYIPPELRLNKPNTPRVLEGVTTPRFGVWSIWYPPLNGMYSLLGASSGLIFIANRLGAHLHPQPGSDPRLRIFRLACAGLLLVAFLAVVWRGQKYSQTLLLLIGVWLAFLAEYMTPSSRSLYAEVFQILPYGVLGPLLWERELPRFYRGCGLVGIFWAILSYAVRPLPARVVHVLTILSFLGPYSAVVFFGGALVYLARRQEGERREENMVVGEETVS